MIERDVPAWEEAPDLPEGGGAWSHVAPLAEVKARRARWAALFDGDLPTRLVLAAVQVRKRPSRHSWRLHWRAEMMRRLKDLRIRMRGPLLWPPVR